MGPFSHDSGEHLTIDDSKIYFEAKGKFGRPLLFLHGGVGSLEDFRALAPLFNDDYFIIVIDSRGHGKSTLGSFPLSYERLQKDAECILKHLGIKKVSIIGFSDGAIVGQRIAWNKEIEVTHLVNIGACWKHKSDPETIGWYKTLMATGGRISILIILILTKHLVLTKTLIS